MVSSKYRWLHVSDIVHLKHSCLKVYIYEIITEFLIYHFEVKHHCFKVNKDLCFSHLSALFLSHVNTLFLLFSLTCYVSHPIISSQLVSSEIANEEQFFKKVSENIRKVKD